jgi:hypothetical protein
VNVVGVQALAGQPHVLGLLIDKLAALRVELLPSLFTADHVHGKASAVVSLARGDSVDPPEPLLPTVPVRVFALVGQGRFERVDLLPHPGQALIGQDTHTLPAVLLA